MFWQTVALVALLLAARGPAAVEAIDRDPIASAIAASIAVQLGTPADIDVDVLTPAGLSGNPMGAAVVPGARFGAPARFVVTFADGRNVTVVARVVASAHHAVATRSLARNTTFGTTDVEWVEGTLHGQLMAPLPGAAAIIGARASRAVAAGEAVTAAVVRPAELVRAGQEVTIVIRSGSVEVSGPGRAVNGGTAGDTIRVFRPGSRRPVSARIIDAASVEISR